MVTIPKKEKKPELETSILQAIQVAINSRDDARVWRNTVGGAKTDYGWVTYGLAEGSADLIGIVSCEYGDMSTFDAVGIVAVKSGRFLSLEIKRPGRARKAELQAAWARTVRAFGGYAAQVTSVAEALAAVEAARRGDP